jgi:hypothetical protein
VPSSTAKFAGFRDSIESATHEIAAFAGGILLLRVDRMSPASWLFVVPNDDGVRHTAAP